MNLGLWPEAVPFDPDDGAGSRELEEHIGGLALPPAVLVVAGQGLAGSAWAPHAAVGLARAVAAGGQDVVLADLDFEAPSLPALLFASAPEGLADVLLFGASLERVTVLPAGQTFEFVAAGEFTPEPERLRSDPGWTRLLGELAARGAVFLGFTRFDAPGLDRLIERIPSVVLLSEPEDASAVVARLPDEVRIEAMIRPARPLGGAMPPAAAAGARVEAVPAEPEEAGVSEAGPGPAMEEPGTAILGPATAAGPPDVTEAERIRLPKDEAREALMAEIEARERVVRTRAAAELAAVTDAVPDADASTAEIGEAASRRRRGWWWWFAAALVAGAAAVWYFGLRDSNDDQPVNPPLAAVQEPPTPAGEALGWSVAVEAHDRLDAAIRRADSLAAADSSIGFQVAPAMVTGDVWYRVLAGPLADSATAVQAMQRLVNRGLKRAAAVWDVRKTPFAFLLARLPYESAALARLNEFKELGIPAYIVEVPYSRGAPWYHVYCGAYADPAEATHMRQALSAAGLPDSLVRRTGRVAS